MENDNSKVMVAAAVVAAVVGAGVYGYRSLNTPAPAPGLSSPAHEPEAPPPSHLPPLESIDAFVRGKAASLSPSPLVAEWLKQENLLERLTAATAMLARGKIPRDALSFLAPRGSFAVIRRGGKTFVDPKSWARYDAAAEAAASIDAVAAVALFTEVEPLLKQAWRGVGDGRGEPRSALRGALEDLIAAPVPAETTELRSGKKGIGWAYADESLEKLGPARKQLMRMGPKNQAKVRAKLEALLKAL